MFYDQFIALCKKNGEKPTPLIKSLGLSAGNIKRWENGSTVNSDILLLLSEHFKVSVDYLLTGKEKGTELPENIPEQELLESYRKLSDFEKGEVLGDIKRRAANAEQVKKPNIQRVYQAARTYNREPIPTVIEADITPLLEAPDATDEY